MMSNDNEVVKIDDNDSNTVNKNGTHNAVAQEGQKGIGWRRQWNVLKQVFKL